MIPSTFHHIGYYQECRSWCFFIAVGLLLLSSTDLRAQRFRDTEVWTSERYARTFNADAHPTDPEVIRWNTSTNQWYMVPQPVLTDPGTPPATRDDRDRMRELMGSTANSSSRNYAVNYESVPFLITGWFSNQIDETFEGTNTTATQTRIPQILFLHAGTAPVGGQNVLQVFSVESRGFRITDPRNTIVNSADAMRIAGTEGLGLIDDGFTVDFNKYDVIVPGSDTRRPTILRYETQAIGIGTIRSLLGGNFTGDEREEAIMLANDGTQTVIYELRNETLLAHANPLDYRFRRITTNLGYGTLDIRDMKHAVSGNFDGDANSEIALFLKNGSTQQIVLLEHDGTSWVVSQVMTPTTGTLDFDNIVCLTRANIDGIGQDEIALVTRATNTATLRHISTSGTWSVAVPSFTFALADVHAGRKIFMTAGDTDGLSNTDEITIVTQRRVGGGVDTVSHFLSMTLASGTWTQKTICKIPLAVLNTQRVQFLVCANLDYDIRHRDDLAVMYGRDPSIAATIAQDDKILFWGAMPDHLQNDFAVDTLSATGVRRAFFPHGWYGLRLSCGQRQGGQYLRNIFYRDAWLRVRPWDIPSHGYNFLADSGAMDDQQLQRYASIYNVTIPERFQFTDDWRYMGTPITAQDNASDFYYYNQTENVTGLMEYMNRARQFRIKVMPYLSFTEHDNYVNPAAGNAVQYHDFVSTNNGGGTLPPYHQLMLTNGIMNHMAFLGWYMCDEPTNISTGSDWHTRFSVPPAPMSPANIGTRLRDYYLTLRHRTPADKMIYVNFNQRHDYEFYRNIGDVEMYDDYVYRTHYPDSAGGVAIRSQPSQNPSNNSASIIYSYYMNALRMMRNTLRCDKPGSMFIVQGRGEDYPGRDEDGSGNTLRIWKDYRNLTADEARYITFGPAVLGARGVVYWDATSWMQGTAMETTFNTVEGGTTVYPNGLVAPLQPAINNLVSARNQRATIDGASAEFAHYRNIFLNEKLLGRVFHTMYTDYNGYELQKITTSLHLDTAANIYYLFVVNNSNTDYPEAAGLDIWVQGIPSNFNVWNLPAEFWLTGRAISIGGVTEVDGIKKFRATIAPFGVQVYAFRPSAPFVPGLPPTVEGELSFINQRKMVVYASNQLTGNGTHADVENTDSVVYHAVYHRADCPTCEPALRAEHVYYRKSEPMHNDEPVDIIRWQNIEYCLSCTVNDPVRGLTSEGSCAYPSVVVRYNQAVQRAQVYVVYACDMPQEQNPPSLPGLPFVGSIRIVENVFDANVPIPNTGSGRVIALATGQGMNTHGFPVIGAIGDGNIVSFSDAVEGIYAAWKGPNDAMFTAQNIQAIAGFNTVQMSDNHPSLWSYSRLQYPDYELPLVWHSAADGLSNSQVFYTRARHLFNGLVLYVPDASIQAGPYPRTWDQRAFQMSNTCGQHTIASVMRASETPYNDVVDHVYWQEFMPCGTQGPLPTSYIQCATVFSRNTDAYYWNDAVALTERHHILHKFDALYLPNVTQGRPEWYDKDTIFRTIVSMLGNTGLYPPDYTGSGFRTSDIWQLKEGLDFDNTPIANVYWKQFSDLVIPQALRTEFQGAQAHQSAMRRLSLPEHTIKSRLIAEYTMNPTPLIGATRRFFFGLVAGPTSTTRDMSFAGLSTSRGGFLGLEGVHVNADRLPVTYDQSGSTTRLLSDWFDATGVTDISLWYRASTNVRLELEDVHGKLTSVIDRLEFTANDEGAPLDITILSTGSRYRLVVTAEEEAVPQRVTVLGATPGRAETHTDDPRFSKTAMRYGAEERVLVDLTKDRTANTVTVTPTPAMDDATLFLPKEAVLSDEAVSVVVFSSDGRIVNVPMSYGRGYITVRTDDLLAGVYTATVTIGTRSHTGRIVVVR